MIIAQFKRYLINNTDGFDVVTILIFGATGFALIFGIDFLYRKLWKKKTK